MKTFIESQFSNCPLIWMFCPLIWMFCPLIWMFCSRKLNRKINHIHERALRLVYEDYTISFEDLLLRDESVSIHHRNLQKVAIELFKVKNGLCPRFISRLFCQTETRTRSKASFHRPNVKCIRVSPHLGALDQLYGIACSHRI